MMKIKPKHCYANEEQYNLNLFMHKATVHAYALDSGLMTQVKFLLCNEETKELNVNKPNRFFFANKNGKSQMFHRQDAITMLETIEIIRNPLVKNYTALLSYRQPDEKRKEDRSIQVPIAGNLSKIIDSGTPVLPGICNRDDVIKRKNHRFMTGLDRLESILKQFICFDDDLLAVNEVPYHYGHGQFTLVPLVNKMSGWSTTSSVRLQVISRKGVDIKNNICFSYKDKDILFYSRENYGVDSSSLSEVVEGFIAGLETLVKQYNEHDSDINYFIGSVLIPLSEDRKHFMEYVGGRGVGGDAHDGPYRTMIVNVNSDAAPGASKVNFHYHPSFMEDLYNGLRFMLTL